MTRAASVVALAVAACAASALPAAGQIAFSDQTAAAGLTHTTFVKFDMNQRQMFAGGAVADFNRDGWPDIFLLGGGDALDSFYINNGDGTFSNQAAAWGLDTQHRGKGATAGDFNKDGWPDIFVTTGGDLTEGDRSGQHMLFKNNGNGTFTEMGLSAGVNETSSSFVTATGAAFGDYDLDGDLDLHVAGWDGFDSNSLFQNNGDETFTDVTLTAGVGHNFYGFSPRFVDMNGDRYPELLIAADYNTSMYYLNNQDGTFTDITLSTGTNQDDNGMGAAIADFNRDGMPDWYVTSIYADLTTQNGNYVYVNDGSDTYTALAESAGAKNGGWGWGADALDIDHDGYIDLVETNGWMPPEWATENSYMFRNNGDLTFTEVQGPGTGFEHVSQGRSLMLLDYDRDGDMDILLTGWDEPVALFRNDLSGPDTNWIEIVLDTSGDPTLAPDGYGSRVIATAGGVTQYFWVNGGATYLGRSQLVAHFGLASATSVDLTVEWANGATTTVTGVPANRIVTLSPEITGAASEAAPQNDPAKLMTAKRNDMTGEIEVRYSPSCGSSNHTIYYGDLANVSSYGYSGAACWLGRAGHASFDPAGISNAFFLIVGNTGSTEGSYGSDYSSDERPEAVSMPGCDMPQDLSATCTP